MISTDPWVWLSALMTIAAFSLLYGENPLFRFGEYTYTATVIGHSVVTGLSTIRNRFTPLFTGQQPMLIFSLVLGIMSIFVVWKKYAWIAAFPMSILIGVGTGISLRGVINTDIVGNMKAIVREVPLIFVGPPINQLGFLVRVTFSLSAIIYLLFTVFHKGPLSKYVEYVRTFGKYAILTYFGLNVGNVLQGNSGQAVAAINRLLRQWLGFG